MDSVKITIHENGKISLSGLITDSHSEHPFEAFLDTGCTDPFSIDQVIADAVCAPVIEEATRSTPGGGSIRVFIRRVNMSFGGLKIQNLNVAVPEKPTGRNLMGISFLQTIGAFVILDFAKGKTCGCLLTNDPIFAHRVGKTLHNLTIHGIDLAGGGPCSMCGQAGR